MYVWLLAKDHLSRRICCYNMLYWCKSDFLFIRELQFWKSWFVFYICNNFLHDLLYYSPYLSLFLWGKYSIKFLYSCKFALLVLWLSNLANKQGAPDDTVKAVFFYSIYPAVPGTLLTEVQGKCSSSLRIFSSQMKLVNETASL